MKPCGCRTWVGEEPTAPKRHDATSPHERFLTVNDYALAATLNSGQTFGWEPYAGGWTSVINRHWVWLSQHPNGIRARVLDPSLPHTWLTDYLQTSFDLQTALRSFPPDPVLQQAIRHHAGLRILRQDPWPCLGSFLLSATKQIVQIRHVYRLLCQQFGEPVDRPPGFPPAFAFPTAEAIVAAGEKGLRHCRMGFRARYLHQTARLLVEHGLNLHILRHQPLDEARARLLQFPGVGRKIADCVLLFSGDQARAFPIDVWMARVLRTHYFGGRTIPLTELQAFAEAHFGPWAGLAQQYLFHHARHPSETSR